MKKLLLVLALFLSLVNAQAQPRIKDTLKFVVLGDSHGVGAYATPREDSSARGILVNYLKQKYNTVIQYSLCRGGATTFSARSEGFDWLPFAPSAGYSFYAAPDTNFNMKKALSYKPDIILIFFTSNCIAFDFDVAAIKRNYLWFNDTASKEKVKIYFVSGTARNSVFSSESSYRDKTIMMKAWLDSTFPGRVINILDGMIRQDTSGHGILPPIDWLSYDNLHYNNIGHRQLGKLLVESEVTDEIAFNYKSYCRDLKIYKINDSIRIKSKCLTYKLIISGSYTKNGNYIQLKKIRNLINEDIDIKIRAYPYIKIQLYGTNKSIITYSKYLP